MRPLCILSALSVLAGCAASGPGWRYVTPAGPEPGRALFGSPESEPEISVACLPSGEVIIEMIDAQPVERWPRAKLTAGSTARWVPSRHDEDGLVVDSYRVPRNDALVAEWLRRGSLRLALSQAETLRIPATAAVRRVLSACMPAPARREAGPH